MSRFAHCLCEKCYRELEPGRIPSRLVSDTTEVIVACCRCGAMHSSGIYYRADPSTMLCDGKHD